MKKPKRILALLLAVMVGAGTLAGCKSSSGVSSVAKEEASSQPANLSLYLYGSEGVANPAIMDQINQKLKKDLNATLTIKYIDWSDVATKYPLLFASGESFDMAYVSSTASVPYATLASQRSLTDITDLLSSTPTLKKAIPDSTWNQAMVSGKIYAVPCLYTEFTPYGFVSRDDLTKKYNLDPVSSVDTMEAYMDAVVKNEKFAPINGDSADAENLYQLFVGMTDSWIPAPGLPNSDLYLVAKSASDYTDIFHPAFTQEFEDWAVRMQNWAKKGYWPKDVLSSQKGAKDNFNNDLSGAFITHQSDWTGNYGALKTSLPGVTTSFWCPAEANGKIERTPAIQNATGISKNCSDPERALKVIEKLMTDKSYYDLFQYGIEGRQYAIKNDQVTQPDSFNKDKDAGGFAGWAFRNDEFNIPYASEDPRRYTLNTEWNKNAIDNPFASFNFSSSNITSQLSSVANVNATLGIQIMFGKESGDAKAAVEKYRSALKSAGIDTIVSEVKDQLKNYSPSK